MKSQGYNLRMATLDELKGKTIKTATSRMDEGVACLEIVFTDETSFSYMGVPKVEVRARTFDADGELIQTFANKF